MFMMFALNVGTLAAQAPSYPKQIRGYKVQRAVVEVKKSPRDSPVDPRFPEDDLIRFGEPRLIKATPLGLSLEIPILVSPVIQRGVVDFLVFEDMKVNGTSIDIDEYQHKFDLPDKKPVTLKHPLKIYITLPSAVVAALGEWTDSKETWPVSGRVFVFGRFKKAFLNFKRCVPVELNLSMRNPLRQ